MLVLGTTKWQRADYQRETRLGKQETAVQWALRYSGTEPERQLDMRKRTFNI